MKNLRLKNIVHSIANSTKYALGFRWLPTKACLCNLPNGYLETKYAHLKDKSEEFLKRKKDEMTNHSKVLLSNSFPE